MVKLTRIYTRTGDDGTTGLVGGERIDKDDALIAAIGDVDEANSAIGVAIAALEGATGEVGEILARLQNELFDLGADLATPGQDLTPSANVLRMIAEQVARLEREIDAANARLTPLASFVLPGGTPAAAHLHVARATIRRAERQAVAASRARPLNPVALAYLNRVSDLLFVLARLLNTAAAGDILWRPGATR